jgi:phthalate 4,5-cis-dihydrodiol dehydrogenase
MLPSFLAVDGIELAGVTDINEPARKKFAEDHAAKAFAGMDELVSDPSIDAVYIATPHGLHAEQARCALLRGKHVLVEKPLALTIEEGLAVARASRETGAQVVVGHTHAFDPAVQLMSEIIGSGRLGRVAMINNWNFNAFLYRPRRPAELDTALGGGIIFNQVPHQVDMARLLGGGLVRAVRASTFILDPARPTEGSQTSFLSFEGGAVANLVFSGYDYYDSDELYGWFGEGGQPRQPAHGEARRSLNELTTVTSESDLRARMGYRGSGSGSQGRSSERRQPHFGMLLVNCQRGDLQATPSGLTVYDDDGAREIKLPNDGPFPDRRLVVEEFYRAAVLGEPSTHDAAWGAATVEVCRAILQSGREQREIGLTHQVGTRGGRSTPAKRES